MGGFAWVTLATNDSYSLGALVLAHSLRNAKTAHKLAVLITPAVSPSMREQLSTVFDLVKVVDVLDSKDEAHLAMMKRPELGVTFTKIHCWRLTEFEKCVFLDADTLVLKNCDELFDREELSAAPDVGWPDCFNTGVFVYKPSIETFNNLIKFSLENGSFDGGDQGLLNQFFGDWATQDIKKHLPFVYNLTSVAVYSYIPAFKQYGSQVRIIHFIGSGKPWLQQLDPTTKAVSPAPGAEHLTPMLQMWWDIFCEKVHPSLSTNLECASGMTDNEVEARPNDTPVEPEPAPPIQPFTPYIDKDDSRQINLPYQPFDVKGESGELLNISYLEKRELEIQEQKNMENQMREEEESREQTCESQDVTESREATEEPREEQRDDGNDREGDGPQEGASGYHEPPQRQSNENPPEVQPPAGEEAPAEEVHSEEPAPQDSPFNYQTFFPDETCVQNYLEQNVMMYQPLDNSSKMADVEQEHNLPRFLTIAEDDQRQSLNVWHEEPKPQPEPQPEPPAQNSPECVNQPQPDCQWMSKSLSEENLSFPEKTNELQGWKSMSNLDENPAPTKKLEEVSFWKLHPSLSVDPNKKFPMPKLKPLLPKQSATQVTIEARPNITQYTEFLMSHDYDDIVPCDKIGFVERRLLEAVSQRASEMDMDARLRTLSYIFPRVAIREMSPAKASKSSPSEKDMGDCDLSSCLRQRGNQPLRNVTNNSRVGNSCFLPVLKPLRPTDGEERPRRLRSSGKSSKERGTKAKVESRKAREKAKAELSIKPPESRSVDVEDVLKKLMNYSKDYQKYFSGFTTDRTMKAKDETVAETVPRLLKQIYAAPMKESPRLQYSKEFEEQVYTPVRVSTGHAQVANSSPVDRTRLLPVNSKEIPILGHAEDGKQSEDGALTDEAPARQLPIPTLIVSSPNTVESKATRTGFDVTEPKEVVEDITVRKIAHLNRDEPVTKANENDRVEDPPRGDPVSHTEKLTVATSGKEDDRLQRPSREGQTSDMEKLPVLTGGDGEDGVGHSPRGDPKSQAEEVTRTEVEHPSREDHTSESAVETAWNGDDRVENPPLEDRHAPIDEKPPSVNKRMEDVQVEDTKDRTWNTEKATMTANGDGEHTHAEQETTEAPAVVGLTEAKEVVEDVIVRKVAGLNLEQPVVATKGTENSRVEHLGDGKPMPHMKEPSVEEEEGGRVGHPEDETAVAEELTVVTDRYEQVGHSRRDLSHTEVVTSKMEDEHQRAEDYTSGTEKSTITDANGEGLVGHPTLEDHTSAVVNRGKVDDRLEQLHRKDQTPEKAELDENVPVQLTPKDTPEREKPTVPSKKTSGKEDSQVGHPGHDVEQSTATSNGTENDGSEHPSAAARHTGKPTISEEVEDRIGPPSRADQTSDREKRTTVEDDQLEHPRHEDLTSNTDKSATVPVRNGNDQLGYSSPEGSTTRKSVSATDANTNRMGHPRPSSTVVTNGIGENVVGHSSPSSTGKETVVTNGIGENGVSHSSPEHSPPRENGAPETTKSNAPTYASVVKNGVQTFQVHPQRPSLARPAWRPARKGKKRAKVVETEKKERTERRVASRTVAERASSAEKESGGESSEASNLFAVLREEEGEREEAPAAKVTGRRGKSRSVPFRSATKPPPQAVSKRIKEGGGAESGGVPSVDNSGIAGAIAKLSLQPGGLQGTESQAASSAQEDYVRRQNWEMGTMDYMGRDSFDNIWSKIRETVDGKVSKDLSSEGESSNASKAEPEASKGDIVPEKQPTAGSEGEQPPQAMIVKDSGDTKPAEAQPPLPQTEASAPGTGTTESEPSPPKTAPSDTKSVASELPAKAAEALEAFGKMFVSGPVAIKSEVPESPAEAVPKPPEPEAKPSEPQPQEAVPKPGEAAVAKPPEATAVDAPKAPEPEATPKPAEGAQKGVEALPEVAAKPAEQGATPVAQPEVKPETEKKEVPPPSAEEPIQGERKRSTEVTDLDEEGKPKKGVLNKILELVGVGPKPDTPTSVFYDTEDAAGKAGEEQKPKSEIKEGKSIFYDVETGQPAGEQTTDKPAEVAPGSGSTDANANAPAEQGAEKKPPSPSLSLKTSPGTEVVCPTPPSTPMTGVPVAKDEKLLTVDDTIKDTPPVTDKSFDKIAAEGAEALKSEVDTIIEAAKKQAEEQMKQGEPKAEGKELGEAKPEMALIPKLNEALEVFGKLFVSGPVAIKSEVPEEAPKSPEGGDKPEATGTAPQPSEPAAVAAPQPSEPAAVAAPQPSEPAAVAAQQPSEPAAVAAPQPSEPAAVAAPQPSEPSAVAAPQPSEPAGVTAPKPSEPADKTAGVQESSVQDQPKPSEVKSEPAEGTKKAEEVPTSPQPSSILSKANEALEAFGKVFVSGPVTLKSEVPDTAESAPADKAPEPAKQPETATPAEPPKDTSGHSKPAEALEAFGKLFVSGPVTLKSEVAEGGGEAGSEPDAVHRVFREPKPEGEPIYSNVEEVEEIKVTSEEDRKKDKPQSSKLSDQILKAIPAAERKPFSEPEVSPEVSQFLASVEPQSVSILTDKPAEGEGEGEAVAGAQGGSVPVPPIPPRKNRTKGGKDGPQPPPKKKGKNGKS